MKTEYVYLLPAAAIIMVGLWGCASNAGYSRERASPAAMPDAPSATILGAYSNRSGSSSTESRYLSAILVPALAGRAMLTEKWNHESIRTLEITAQDDQDLVVSCYDAQTLVYRSPPLKKGREFRSGPEGIELTIPVFSVATELLNFIAWGRVRLHRAEDGSLIVSEQHYAIVLAVLLPFWFVRESGSVRFESTQRSIG